MGLLDTSSNIMFDPNNPTAFSYNQNANTVALQRAIAQQAAVKPSAGQMVSGWYVAPSALTNVSNLLSNGLSAYLTSKSLNNQNALDSADKAAFLYGMGGLGGKLSPDQITGIENNNPIPQTSYTYKNPLSVGPIQDGQTQVYPDAVTSTPVAPQGAATGSPLPPASALPLSNAALNASNAPVGTQVLPPDSQAPQQVITGAPSGLPGPMNTPVGSPTDDGTGPYFGNPNLAAQGAAGGVGAGSGRGDINPTPADIAAAVAATNTGGATGSLTPATTPSTAPTSALPATVAATGAAPSATPAAGSALPNALAASNPSDTFNITQPSQADVAAAVAARTAAAQSASQGNQQQALQTLMNTKEGAALPQAMMARQFMIPEYDSVKSGDGAVIFDKHNPNNNIVVGNVNGGTKAAEAASTWAKVAQPMFSGVSDAATLTAAQSAARSVGMPESMIPTTVAAANTLASGTLSAADKNAQAKTNMDVAGKMATTLNGITSLQQIDNKLASVQQGLTTGAIKTGPLAGPIWDNLSVLPGVDRTNYDLFHNAEVNDLGQTIRQALPNARITQQEIQVFRAGAINRTNTPQANLQIIAQQRAAIQAQIQAAQQEAAGYAGTYQSTTGVTQPPVAPQASTGGSIGLKFN